jgi:hypothetical protein
MAAVRRRNAQLIDAVLLVTRGLSRKLMPALELKMRDRREERASPCTGAEGETAHAAAFVARVINRIHPAERADIGASRRLTDDCREVRGCPRENRPRE